MFNDYSAQSVSKPQAQCTQMLLGIPIAEAAPDSLVDQDFFRPTPVFSHVVALEEEQYGYGSD